MWQASCPHLPAPQCGDSTRSEPWEQVPQALTSCCVAFQLKLWRAGGQGWGPTLKAFPPDAQIHVTNERASFCWALGASEPVLYKQIKIPNSSGTC